MSDHFTTLRSKGLTMQKKNSFSRQAYEEPRRTSEIGFFAKIANDCQPLTILQQPLFYTFDWVLNTPLIKYGLTL